MQKQPTIRLIALASLLALAACGGGQSESKPQASAAPASGELAEKQVLVINNSAEPESLDPHKVSGVPESNLIRQMLVGLTSTDNDGKTVPGMAESWENVDFKVWTFKLRDAKWSNGDPVTAEDFAYSMRRVVDPKTASPYASYLADAKVLNAQDVIDGKKEPSALGVKVIDDKTLEITLSEPVPYFPDMLIHTSTKPVNKKTVEALGDKWTAPENFVANGPYQLSAWTVNDRIVMKRNPNYYDNANTKIEEVTFLVVNSSVTDVQRYKAGEIDVTYNDLPNDQFASIKQEMGSELKVSPYLCTYYYEFNNAKAPFNDARVRKALALALDRDTMAEKVVGRGETPAYQFVPPATAGNQAFTPDWKAWSKEQRIEEAKKLLAEAGYGPDKPLSFELLYNTNENHKKNAVAASALWKEALGFVEATLTNQEWKTYLDSRRNGNYQMARAGWCSDYNEGSSFLNILKTGNSSNYGKYSNSEFDQLMAKTVVSGTSDEQRNALYAQAEAVLDKDAPDIFVYHYVSPRLVKPYVAGYSDKDPQDNFQVKYWSVLKH